MLVDLCCGPAVEQAEMDDCHSHDCCDTEITVSSIDDVATVAVAAGVTHVVLNLVATVPVLQMSLPVSVARIVGDHPPHSPPDLQAFLGVFLI